MAFISILRAIFYWITGKLTFPRKYVDKTIVMEDGLKFKIFRHMKKQNALKTGEESIFIIKFKFRNPNHNANIKSSRKPILMIAGFKGFRDKVWMIDWETGYWQGVYQWDCVETIEKYKNSFVLGMMFKRAIDKSITLRVEPNINIENFLEDRI